MTTCFLISLSVQREPLIYNSLALSALIILIFTPQQLFTASFQMSYAATIAIVYFYKKFYVPFSKVRNRFLKILIGAFCATTAAQVTMIPISAYYFGQFSLVSFISNTVIVPLVGFITTLGFVFYILTFISKFLAAGAAFILEILLDAVLAAVSFFGQTKYAALIVPKPHIWQAVLFFAGSFAAPCLKGAKRIIVLAIILGIFVTFFMTIGGSKNGEAFYENRNMSVLHIKSDKKDLFIVRKKLKYDKNYVKSLGEYIRFNGIKNPDLIAEGFDERLLREDLGLLRGQRAGFSQID
jgi:competence protein ComEC